MENHTSRHLVKISTERLVETHGVGHATLDEGKKRDKKRDKAENRTRTGLERMLDGKMAGHGLDGKRAYDSCDSPSYLGIHQD